MCRGSNWNSSYKFWHLIISSITCWWIRLPQMIMPTTFINMTLAIDRHVNSTLTLILHLCNAYFSSRYNLPQSNYHWLFPPCFSVKYPRLYYYYMLKAHLVRASAITSNEKETTAGFVNCYRRLLYLYVTPNL